MRVMDYKKSMKEFWGEALGDKSDLHLDCGEVTCAVIVSELAKLTLKTSVYYINYIIQLI